MTLPRRVVNMRKNTYTGLVDVMLFDKHKIYDRGRVTKLIIHLDAGMLSPPPNDSRLILQYSSITNSKEAQ